MNLKSLILKISLVLIFISIISPVIFAEDCDYSFDNSIIEKEDCIVRIDEDFNENVVIDSQNKISCDTNNEDISIDNTYDSICDCDDVYISTEDCEVSVIETHNIEVNLSNDIFQENFTDKFDNIYEMVDECRY